MSNFDTKELWVCWVKPNCLPPENIRILSFLKPADEEDIIQSISEKGLVSGRKIAQEVKDDALKLYTDIVARIGSAKIGKTHSLRELLKSNGGNSLWWYHPVSFKDCEGDPTFNRIIQILAIDRFATENSFESIVFWGADYSVANVLKSKYQVECKNTKHVLPVFRCLRAFASRIKQLVAHAYHWYLISNELSDVAFNPDVVLEGFWDWSVRPDTPDKGLDDRYFKLLPNLLEQQDLKVAWFLWFDPHSEPRFDNRSAIDVLHSARPHKNLIFLQKYLQITDILKEFCDFRPAIKYYSIAGTTGFKELYKSNGLNLLPIFRDQLSYHFISPTIPHYNLVEKACVTAFDKFGPKIALTFLEMFPYSRAFYTGARLGSPETKLATMQHASYSREKTFIRLDPEIEFQGKPDNCPIPKPDYVFGMGELGKEIFQEAGFLSREIFLTGSARYDHIRVDPIGRYKNESAKTLNLLLVTSLDREIEIDMVEAVYLATKDMPSINLLLRNHPFARMDEHPHFQPMKERITITDGTLEEDLQKADLILFSYSTVAEEALIRGLSVWQWCSAGYNGSVFRDIKAIPAFYSILELRESLKNFLDNPVPFFPDEKTRNTVLDKCFYKADEKASERIASKISNLLN